MRENLQCNLICKSKTSEAKYSLGSNELGQLSADNNGNHRTIRERVFAQTHMHTYRPQECSVTRGHSGCMLG